ncbi:MAG: hypothetical protein R6T83_07600 [Salinibacter sp.]
MQVLLDNLAAVVIGSTVLLIIAFTQFRGQEAAIGGVQYYAATSQMVDLIRQLQLDLHNVGAGVPNADVETGAALVSYATSGDTTEVFAFRTYADSAAFATKPTPDLVCYQRDLTGTTAHVRDPATGTFVEKPTFRIVRRVNPTAPADCTGGTETSTSMASLTEFHVDLRDDNGTETATFSEVRQLGVHVRGVSPLGGGETEHRGGMKQHVDEARFNAVVRPPNLTRYAP